MAMKGCSILPAGKKCPHKRALCWFEKVLKMDLVSSHQARLTSPEAIISNTPAVSIIEKSKRSRKKGMKSRPMNEIVAAPMIHF